MNNEEVVSISQKSWHYRTVHWMYHNPLWNSYRDYGWKSLCTYGRKLIFALLIFYPIIVPILLLAFVFERITRRWIKEDIIRETTSGLFEWFILSILIFYSWYQIRIEYGWSGFLVEGMPWYYKVVDFIAVFNIIAIAIFSISIIYFVTQYFLWDPLIEEWKYLKQRFERTKEGETGESAMSIIVKTYLAWKNKVCPPVEFVD